MNYASLSDVTTYLAGVINTTAWDNSDDVTRTKALTQATRIIDRLSYDLEKLDETQTNKFPLTGQTEVPAEIMYACIEIALELLKGFDIEKEKQALVETSTNIGGASSNYNRNNTPEHVLAGVPSSVAWNYLKQYLADMDSVSMMRVS